MGRNRVARLCREQRVFSVIVKRRGRIKVAGPVVHDDHVQRQFKTTVLDQAWFTDITEHPTSEGKLYVCAVKDACSNRIVGLSMGPRMTSDLACNALRYAIDARSPVGRSCTPIGAASSVPEPSPPPCVPLACKARWDESPPLRTTRPWSPSSPCCKRTS